MEETRSVLVTGASTGIGREITERLAGAGHVVYAGARKASDLEALAKIQNVVALRLDVTNSRDISLAVDVVGRGGSGLYALVNNAGVATFGPVLGSIDEEFELIMSVNVYGVYRITKAFAPFIVAAKGRIVSIGSISGILAGANVSAYSMSKHAIEAFTDSLAEEMKPFGVEVSVIEPGSFNTELSRNIMGRIGADSKLPDLSLYRGPVDVAEAVDKAIFEPRPKRRYLVAQNADEVERTIRKQIEQLAQLNEDHSYTYDRNALIGMLDATLDRTHSARRR